MGKIVRFSEFDNYFNNLLSNSREIEGTILDANVLITLCYSPKRFHTRLLTFLEQNISKRYIPCYTTVNTSQEFLEFFRRLLLTEGLRTAIHPSSGIKLSNKKRRVISAQSSILAARERNHGADPVFYDRELKRIRDVFCNSGFAGLELWKAMCEIYLKNQLLAEFKNLHELNVEYISSRKEEMARFFVGDILWEGAIDICGIIGAGFSDSMIINALQCSTFPFAITLDSDLAFAAIANQDLKDVVMPDELIDSNDGLIKLLS